jgi:tetratricopeptide (TPR) repeat protein
MKRSLLQYACVAIMLVLGASSALAQRGTVRGTCRDADGKPIVGATVEFYNAENGRKFPLKTNNKGEFFSIGLEYGSYQVTLTKDGQQLDRINKIQVVSGDNPAIDFDIKKVQAEAAQRQGISPEQMKQMKEQEERQAKEVSTVKTLNEKLAAATQASAAGDYDGAIATLTQASQMDPSRDLIWAHLGDAYISSAAKQTDNAEKTKRYEEAVNDYQKAVDLRQKAIDAGLKNPDNNKALAKFYNNLAQAESKTGKTDEATKAYEQAAQLDPTAAGQYYFNLGAILTNSGKVDEAIAAFDKSIAADPNKAASYYWKGVDLLGKATLKGDKMVAPDGTAEAFNKYLELEPTGQFADPAKQMLASIGATVETQFGKPKTATKKK